MRRRRILVSKMRPPACEAVEARLLMSADFPPAFDDPMPFELGPATAEPVSLWLEPAELEVSGGGATQAIALGGSARLSSHDLRTIRLAFDRPLVGDFVGQDLAISRLATEASGEEPNIIFSRWDPADPNAILVDLDQQLAPGDYRIDISWFTMITGVDGSMVEPGRALAQITVVPSGLTLADAVDLGTVGAAPTEVTDGLALETDPSALKLYRFEVPKGSELYRFGAQLETSIGSSRPRASLALLDSGGRLLQSASLGLPQSAGDPFLFAGLEPGTYYVAVAGAGNLPDRPGAYDLVEGFAATGLAAQSGGQFRLSLAAAAAGDPTHVLDATPVFADPLDTSPTSIELTFSQALLPRADAWPVLEVVDATGRSVAAVPSRYDWTSSRLTLSIASPLAAGHYTLRNAPEGGLSDLAGRAPVADGLPSGVLAEFDVQGREEPRASNDYGTLYAGSDSPGLAIAASLRAGETRTYRFVMSEMRIVNFSYRTDRDALIELATPTGSPVDLRRVDATESGILALLPGVYEIRVTALGTEGTTVLVGIRPSSTRYESITLNGIGQSSVLPLLVVTPRVNLPAPIASRAGATDLTLGITAGPVIPGAVGSNAGAATLLFGGPAGGDANGSLPAIASTSPALVAAGTILPWTVQPAGQPGTLAGHLAPVEPGRGNSVALADVAGAMTPGETVRAAAAYHSIALTTTPYDEVPTVTVAETADIPAPTAGQAAAQPAGASLPRRLAWLLGGLEERAVAMLADQLAGAGPADAPTAGDPGAVLVAEGALVNPAGGPEALPLPTEARMRPALPVTLLSLAVIMCRGQALTFLSRWRQNRPGWRRRGDETAGPTFSSPA